MTTLSPEAVVQWQVCHSVWYPHALRLLCEKCRALAVHQRHDYQPEFSNQMHTVTLKVACGGCSSVHRVFVVGPAPAAQTTEPKCIAILIHPTPAHERAPIAGIAHAPQGVRQHYAEALRCFDYGLWSLVASSCRTAIEQLAKRALTQSAKKRSLGEMLKDLESAGHLSKGGAEVAHAIRLLGNAAAHGDQGVPQDERTAEASLALLEFLLEDQFVLPELARRVRALSSSPEPAAERQPETRE